MQSSISPRTRALLQALFVTFLWATSWVFIKIGLRDSIPALTFAGLRYTLAFMCLLVIGLRRRALLAPLKTLPAREWRKLLVLGLLSYTLNQGAQFVGLSLLPSLTVNMLSSFPALIVTLAGMVVLAEYPTRLQWGGVALYVCGVLVYFLPVAFSGSQINGLLVMVVGILANSSATLLGRSINRAGRLHPLAVTTVSMGVGSVILLFAGLVTQGLPPLSLSSIVIIGWLAVVNTAFAFTLWNHTQRTLSAMESSIINNTLLIQIPFLVWLFLGEEISPKAGIGLALAACGIVMVQLRRVPWWRKVKEGMQE